MIDFDKISKIINFTSQLAGRKIMELYKSYDFKLKNDGSPLTKADTEANKIITDNISKQIPNIKIISEENNETNDSDIYFLIDPLDGTKEFLSKNGEFTVNIALIINKEPVLGSIYVPAKDELFWNDNKNSFIKFRNNTKKIFTKNFPDNYFSLETSRSHLDKKTQQFIKYLEPQRTNKTGSSIKICNIARGNSNIYPRLGKICTWDIAAGHSILKKAGGEIFNLKGKKFMYKKKENLVESFIAFSEKSIPNEIITNAQKFI